MGNWISKDGKWTPKKEHVVLPEFQGTDKEVYDGPDRDASQYLKEQGLEYLGEDFRDNPDMHDVAAKFNCKDPEEFAKKRGWKPEVEEKKFEEKESQVVTHRNPIRIKGNEPQGGGVNIKGGWKDTLPNAEG